MGGAAVPELAGAAAAAGAVGILCEFGIEAAADGMTRAFHLAGGGAAGMGSFGHWIGADPGNFEAATPRLRVVQVCWTDPDAALMLLLASVPARTSIPVVAAGGRQPPGIFGLGRSGQRDVNVLGGGQVAAGGA
jgi:hypothetical protein